MARFWESEESLVSSASTRGWYFSSAWATASVVPSEESEELPESEESALEPESADWLCEEESCELDVPTMAAMEGSIMERAMRTAKTVSATLAPRDMPSLGLADLARASAVPLARFALAPTCFLLVFLDM